MITLVYILKYLILPPTSLLILAIIGLLNRKQRYGLLLLSVSLLLLFLLSLPVVVNQWAHRLELFLPLQTKQVQLFNPQAIVVISGGAIKGAVEYQSPVTINTRTLLRVRYAAKLAKEMSLPILVSGGCVLEAETVAEADLMADVLINEFKTPVAWREQNSQNTAENAIFSRRLLQEHAINKIILVTQAYHMPRAVNEFRKVGFDVLPAPTTFIGLNVELSVFDFLPSSTALMNSYLLAHETLGMLWYRIRY